LSFLDHTPVRRPIIQNGKLVGAVPHGLVNDPTAGYEILIENMPDTTNIPMAKV